MDTKEMRQEMIRIVQNVGAGHLGTSLSSLDIILAIFEVMGLQDMFFSSKGHDALAQYVALASKGVLSWTKVLSFRQPGGLPSHPTVDIPGIVANTGSLGMGLSKALGFAISDPSRTVYVLLGDGEMMEGQNWEAALAAAKHGVKNIIAVVDCNGFSQDGLAALNMKSIERMFDAAGWNVMSLYHQHDQQDLINTLGVAKVKPYPVAILRQTLKGQGASFEGTWQSHAGPPRDDYSVKHPLYKAFGEAVEKLMEQDPLAVLCGADTLRDHNCYDLKNRFPNRVFDFGIAEQNIVSFASALALDGLRPIVVTYAAFLRRAFEQIYNQVTEGTKVIYVGSMAGPLEDGGPGISHQSLDDAEYMGNLMNVYNMWPRESWTMETVLDVLSDDTKSHYLRLMHHD